MPAPRREPPEGEPVVPAGAEEARRGFLLRLSPALLAELRAWAAQEVRSLNGHIEYLLRQAVQVRKHGRPRS